MNEKEKIDILLKVYEITGHEIQTRAGTNQRILGLGLTVLGAGFIYGVKEGVKEILLLVPVGLFGVMFHSIFLTTGIMTLGGYRRYLEEKINTILGEHNLIWEKMARKLLHRHFSLAISYLIWTLALVLAIYVSLQNAWQFFGIQACLALLIVHASLLVALIFSIVKLSRAFDKAYQLAWIEANEKIMPV